MTEQLLTLQRARALQVEGPVRSARRGLAGAGLAVGMVAAMASQAWARPAPESFAELTAKVSPAVVNIAVESAAPEAGMTAPEGMDRQFGPDSPFRDFLERFFGQDMPGFETPEGRPAPRQRATSAGSGFIVDSEGYIVTNQHVVARAGEITVTLSDGESYDATLVGADERSDLALLKIEAEKSLPAVAFGDSDSVQAGDWVLAVGNPFGLGGTVTAGIVSARGRALPGGALIDYMQIDAPINRGNSGGPSFNIDGEVIGVNTAIFTPNGGSVGIGFAIPSNLATKVVAELRESGSVERGWLGVQIQQVSPDIAEGLGLDEARGALVASVVEDGPAAEAGFQPGDVILEWDDKPIAKMRDLPRHVADTDVGKRVAVRVWRDREETGLEVTTGKLPGEERLASTTTKAPNQQGAVALPGTGLEVVALNDRLRQRFDVPADTSGVVVVDVDPNSAAAEQNIRPGDVIVSIALNEVSSTDEALDRIEALRETNVPVATLMLSRSGDTRFVALRLAQV